MSRPPSWFATKRGKRDKAHASIARALEKLGFVVADLGGAADGVPDLSVRWPRWQSGRWEWLELKSDDGELTPAQVTLHATWLAKGIQVHVVHSLDEALAVLR